MRSHIWAVAALAGVAGLVAAAGPARAQLDPKTVVATVNGRTITMGEVETAIKARPLAVEITADQRKMQQFNVLCLLIDGVLWEQYLHKHGPRIESAEVNKRMAELEQWVTKAKKTMPDYYKETGQTEATVRAGITSVLQWEVIARGKISDADVKRYYDENKDFFDGVLVHASHIVLKVPTNAPDAEKQAARDKLLAIRAHLVAGKLDFAEAAKRYSQDVTAPEGGDLGSFPRKMVMHETIAKVAFSLPVNGVSDVVTTEYGLHLIKVTERKPGETPSDFAKIKDYVRELCTQELQLSLLDQLRHAADIKITLPK